MLPVDRRLLLVRGEAHVEETGGGGSRAHASDGGFQIWQVLTGVLNKDGKLHFYLLL